ncbi:MAG: dTDP-4-dehydrorhamnose reductase [Nitriliruptor sp.]
MRILITGAGGQLASDVRRVCADDDVTALSHAELDVSDEAAVVEAVHAARPEVVCNLAAWTDVDGCEGDPDRAHESNALGPWWLARACRRSGAVLVHLSTDYVFGGSPAVGPDGTPRPWSETDAVDPRSVYGRSKAAGEQLIRDTLTEHVIVRTAWLAGTGGPNFVRTMLRLGHEGAPVTVVDDQFGSPTFTADLAPAIRHLAVARRYGTFHVANEGRASWFELAAATFELAGLEVSLSPQPSSALERPAPRPAWSVLDTRHARLAGMPPLPPWRQGLRRLLGELGELRTAGPA